MPSNVWGLPFLPADGEDAQDHSVFQHTSAIINIVAIAFFVALFIRNKKWI